MHFATISICTKCLSSQHRRGKCQATQPICACGRVDHEIKFCTVQPGVQPCRFCGDLKHASRTCPRIRPRLVVFRSPYLRTGPPPPPSQRIDNAFAPSSAAAAAAAGPPLPPLPLHPPVQVAAAATTNSRFGEAPAAWGPTYADVARGGAATGPVWTMHRLDSILLALQQMIEEHKASTRLLHSLAAVFTEHALPRPPAAAAAVALASPTTTETTTTTTTATAKPRRTRRIAITSSDSDADVPQQQIDISTTAATGAAVANKRKQQHGRPAAFAPPQGETTTSRWKARRKRRRRRHRQWLLASVVAMALVEVVVVVNERSFRRSVVVGEAVLLAPVPE